MKYEDLFQKVKNIPCFSEAFLATRPSQVLRNQLNRWTKQKKIIRLKRGVYSLPYDYQKKEVSQLFISNILYSPSYVSLEFALNFYGLIPERVHLVTAISTHKTKLFQNDFGNYSYHHVKRDYFFGYEKIRDFSDQAVLIATPEKALIDKIYFDPMVKIERGYFIDNLRLQNFERLRITKLEEYSNKMNSLKVKRMIKILIKLIREEKT